MLLLLVIAWRFARKNRQLCSAVLVQFTWLARNWCLSEVMIYINHLLSKFKEVHSFTRILLFRNVSLKQCPAWIPSSMVLYPIFLTETIKAFSRQLKCTDQIFSWTVRKQYILYLSQRMLVNYNERKDRSLSPSTPLRNATVVLTIRVVNIMDLGHEVK